MGQRENATCMMTSNGVPGAALEMKNFSSSGSNTFSAHTSQSGSTELSSGTASKTARP